jgi:hypothetical protein
MEFWTRATSLYWLLDERLIASTLSKVRSEHMYYTLCWGSLVSATNVWCEVVGILLKTQPLPVLFSLMTRLHSLRLAILARRIHTECERVERGCVS